MKLMEYNIIWIVWCITQLQFFSYILAGSALIHAFLNFFLTSTPHNILSKVLAAFPHNHCRNNGQR